MNHAPAAEPPSTAQDAFKRLMLEHIGPGLREFGFKGSFAKGFRHISDDHVAGIGFEKSLGSTKREVGFWLILSAHREGGPHWGVPLPNLTPQPRRHTWAVTCESRLAAVGSGVLAEFRDYGWPAIQAVLAAMGDPPGPDGRWPRTFPPPGQAEARVAPGLGPVADLLRPAGGEDDDTLARVSDPDEGARISAVSVLGTVLENDPRVAPVLANRLEHDPSAAVRFAAVRGLTALALQPDVRQALQAAAEQDEEFQVRWAARYAIAIPRPGWWPWY